MLPKIASLTVYDLNNGYVRVVGTVTIDDVSQDVECEVPRFMVDALVTAARQQGALT